MSGGGSSTPVVQTQTKDPWSGQQPYLNQLYATASGYFGNDFGNKPYTGPTQIDPNTTQDLAAAIQRNRWLTDQNPYGSAGLQGAQANAANVVGSQGINQGIGNAVGALSNAYNAYGQQYAGLGGLAAAYQGHATDPTLLNQYSSIYNQNAGGTNPYLQSQIDAQGRKIADQVNSAMSGAGRYGSGAHTNVLSRNLAEAADPILAQDWQSRQQNMLNATAGGLNAVNQQMAALQGVGQTNAQQMAALQGQAGIAGNQADIYQQGLNQAGQYSQLIPSLDQAQFANIDRIGQYGDIQRQYQQAQLNDQISLANAQEARPWEQLGRYAALIQGGGNLGGTTVTSSPTGTSPFQGALGGALTGAALGSPFGGGIGSLVGAGAGGLLGYLGGR